MKDADIFLIKLKYKSFPGSNVAPKGSTIPVLIFISFATAVAKDMNIKTGIVDPLGATLDPGKDLYFNLIRNMSASFKGC